MGADDRDDCTPQGHTYAVVQLDVAGYRLRQVWACACGATVYYGAGDVAMESRQPLVDRRDARDGH